MCFARLINGEVVWFKGPEVDLSKLTTSTSYAAHFAPAIVLAVPFLLSLFGLWQSLRHNPWQEVHCSLSDRPEGKALVRVPSCTSAVKDAAAESHVLRIVQITDPHLGPFMSVSHLSKICTEVALSNICLTFIAFQQRNIVLLIYRPLLWTQTWFC